jgi:hypothetical protein
MEQFEWLSRFNANEPCRFKMGQRDPQLFEFSDWAMDFQPIQVSDFQCFGQKLSDVFEMDEGAPPPPRSLPGRKPHRR